MVAVTIRCDSIVCWARFDPLFGQYLILISISIIDTPLHATLHQPEILCDVMWCDVAIWKTVFVALINPQFRGSANESGNVNFVTKMIKRKLQIVTENVQKFSSSCVVAVVAAASLHAKKVPSHIEWVLENPTVWVLCCVWNMGLVDTHSALLITGFYLSVNNFFSRFCSRSCHLQYGWMSAISR